MTALLAKLGLNLATGKNLWPLAAVLGAFAALIGAALYATHHYTAIGYENATAECRANAQAANERRTEAETQLREATREVIIRHTADQTALAANVTQRKQEVSDYAKDRPELGRCGLDERGLRLWNAEPSGPPAGAALPVRPEAQGTERPQPPGSASRGTPQPHAEPRGQQGRLQSALSEAPGPDVGSRGLRTRTSEGHGSRIGLAYLATD